MMVTEVDPVAELVRKLFAAFLAGDRAALEEILSDDFTFNSPRRSHRQGRVLQAVFSTRRSVPLASHRAALHVGRRGVCALPGRNTGRQQVSQYGVHQD